MANILEYTLSLNDQMSNKLQKIGINSGTALDKFAELEKKTTAASKVMNDMGRSIGSLQERVSALKAERDWIPKTAISDIRKYNHEIKDLEKEILKLQTINGSKIKTYAKEAIQQMPGAALVMNPLVAAGAGIAAAGKMSFGIDEGMAKINTTAQLSAIELDKLKTKLIDLGVDAGADLSRVPESYEKIISQTGDVALSTDILQKSLKGSKAGFTDVSIVSGALAQTLSLVGKENTNAQEVLDTLFAGKRVGAGEFKDFATYIPALTASGKALGIGFKETAGIFTYMTGKGLDAAKSATLVENAYTALGKSDITSGMTKAGISVFNKDGSMKHLDEIMIQMQKKLEGFGKNDSAKSNFLESIGLKDAQAKQAFMVMASDGAKLSQTLKDVANSSGETDKAFALSANPMQKIEKLWSQVQKLAISFGGIVSSILVPAMSILAVVIAPVFDMFSWFFDGLTKGNPAVLILAGSVAVLTLAYNAQAKWLAIVELWSKRKLITDKLMAFWSGVVSVATNIWTGAQWLLNAAFMAFPIITIIIAIAALVALVYEAITHFRSWGATVLMMLGPIGWLINLFMVLKDNWDSIVQAFKGEGIIAGIKRIGIVILDAFLYPLQQFLSLIAKIPGMKNIAGSAADELAKLRKGLDLVTTVETTDEKKTSPYKVGGSSQFQEMVARMNGEAKDKGSKPNENLKDKTKAVSEGGHRSTSITLNVKNIVESIVFEGGLKENTNSLVQQIQEGIILALRAAEATA